MTVADPAGTSARPAAAVKAGDVNVVPPEDAAV
jgi:hypothetical protein